MFAYATNPATFVEWQEGVVGGSMETKGESVQVGDLCRMTRRIGFMNQTSTSTVANVDPPHAWGVRGIDGPIRAMVDVNVEPVTDASARLTISIAFEGHGIGRLLVPLVVERSARKEMLRDLAALKHRMELAQ